MMDELDWIRWQLDRLVSARLTGALTSELEERYARLARREQLLMQREQRSAS